jgi:outer membrane protein OmpA-like peptidoglycan-associated protein
MQLRKIYIKIIKNFFLITALITISFNMIACSKKQVGFDVIANENALRNKGTYEAYLSLEYLDFYRNLLAGKNKKDAEYFLTKSQKAAEGKIIIPENPINWQADPNQIEEMVAMQKRLDVLLNPRLQIQLPIQMAHLTFLYDCWIAKESKPIFRNDELAKCKSRFYRLLEEIEIYADSQNTSNQEKTIIIQPEFRKATIPFDLNSFKLNSTANKILVKTIDDLVKLQGDFRIMLIGNADRTGSELRNQNLASKRVELVKNYLTKNGVLVDMIDVKSFGEDLPDLITSDNAQKINNRNVLIYVIKGKKSFDDYPLPLIENIIYREEIIKAKKNRGLK